MYQWRDVYSLPGSHRSTWPWVCTFLLQQWTLRCQTARYGHSPKACQSLEVTQFDVAIRHLSKKLQTNDFFHFHSKNLISYCFSGDIWASLDVQRNLLLKVFFFFVRPTTRAAIAPVSNCTAWRRLWTSTTFWTSDMCSLCQKWTSLQRFFKR